MSTINVTRVGLTADFSLCQLTICISVLLPADHRGAPTGDDDEPLDPESTDPEVQRKLSGIIVDDVSAVF